MTRPDDLRVNLEGVRRRIDTAALAAGRDPSEVTLVVVTKFFPATDVRLLAELGVTDVGENRHQEAAEKAAECSHLGLRWHFIGGLQSNKAAAVAGYSDVVESLDRPKLVTGLQRGAQERGRDVDVFLQVSLDPPGVDHRAGAVPTDLSTLAAAVEAAGSLRLCGLMAVAPLDEDPNVAFERLSDIRTHFTAHYPHATQLSAGMSSDLEAAITHGATHVRVGSAVLGPRPLNR